MVDFNKMLQDFRAKRDATERVRRREAAEKFLVEADQARQTNLLAATRVEKKLDESSLHGHPVMVIQELAKVQPFFELSFKHYTYSKQYGESDYKHGTGVDIDFFNAKITEVDASWVKNALDQLPGMKTDEGLSPELALESRMTYHGYSYHLPMVDFCGEVSERGLLEFFRALRTWSREWSVFHSGRSYHAYGHTPFQVPHYHEYLADLLLASQYGATVDDRWVAHRLKQGCMSLRWSCNSAPYRQLPRAYKGFVLPAEEG